MNPLKVLTRAAKTFYLPQPMQEQTTTDGKASPQQIVGALEKIKSLTSEQMEALMRLADALGGSE